MDFVAGPPPPPRRIPLKLAALEVENKHVRDLVRDRRLERDMRGVGVEVVLALSGVAEGHDVGVLGTDPLSVQHA